jgi:hypothetical protein
MPRPFFLALLGALILGSAIVALNLAEHDQARMIERPCGALHWSPGAVPVRVRVDESAADWTGDILAGAAAWNRAAGREVLTVEPRMGVQGIDATVDQAQGLLIAATEAWREGRVTLSTANASMGF